jgi:hypothetical protein
MVVIVLRGPRFARAPQDDRRCSIDSLVTLRSERSEPRRAAHPGYAEENLMSDDYGLKRDELRLNRFGIPKSADI